MMSCSSNRLARDEVEIEERKRCPEKRMIDSELAISVKKVSWRVLRSGDELCLEVGAGMNGSCFKAREINAMR